RSLGELGLDQPPEVRGAAIELRVNAETLDDDGSPVPAAGTVTEVAWPAGPGVRVDTAVRTGTRIDPRFDTLVAKLVVSAPDEEVLWRRVRRALAETSIGGVATNLGLLAALVEHPEVASGRWHTTLVDELLPELVAAAAHRTGDVAGVGGASGAGGDRSAASARPAPPAGAVPVEATMPATVVAVEVEPGDPVAAGRTVVVLESMKMEHLVAAPVAGHVDAVAVAVGDTVATGDWLVAIRPGEVDAAAGPETVEIDLDVIRDDLAEVLDRHERLEDHRRPDAVARRRARGQRTARENLADLVDPGSFVEYGALAVAAQHRRRSMEDLIERTSTDGIIVGTARVNGELFGPEASTCAVMIYDYTVLAGTQGHRGHLKMDRILELAHRHRLPFVLYAEGGGGRPGDVDVPSVAGLDVPAFHLMARLSGHVPTVGVVSGYCFAGNAVLVGCCDTIVATENANLGAGGPAMIEGGGLGRFAPTDIGPIDDLWRAGSVEVRVDDEAAATEVVKRYLACFQGPVAPGEADDQRRLRHLVPENRVRVYDVRAVVTTLADAGTVLELRGGYGHGMVTALARVEGRPVGILANDPAHLGGAIDAPGADKAARFLQLCDAFALPVVVLCDTPGIMVGPEAEREATVRHASRLFVVGANLSVPMGTVVLRKGYGLGAQAMAAGGFKANAFTVSWPTGEFGGMNLEGAVRLGYRRELEAITDPDERERRYRELVADAYARGRALNIATTFELDAVIDPAETRTWIRRLLDLGPGSWRDRPPPRPHVDTW
ncbi:MAG: carbamoyl-phosphate synthase large subunit, partial [Actinomyces sp.]